MAILAGGHHDLPRYKVYRESTMSCRKAADTIDMWFRMKTHMVPWNCVLAGGQEPQGKGQFWWAPPSAMQPFVKNSLNACLKCGLIFDHLYSQNADKNKNEDRQLAIENNSEIKCIEQLE